MSAHRYINEMMSLSGIELSGRVKHIGHTSFEATGPYGSLGDLCTIETSSGQITAEIAGLSDTTAILVPLEAPTSVLPGARIVKRSCTPRVLVGDEYGGRLINALGVPLDEAGPITPDNSAVSCGVILSPLERRDSGDILPTGVSSIDGLLPIGRGQRIGVFAPSGVGKTSLVKQLAAQTKTDRCILCLVGERGREVENFWSCFSQRSDASKFTCVAATSDQSAALRIKAIDQAVNLAEYWRSKGQDVLLIVDSVTRYAMALREIGLAAGAPPTLRAYTPNVFDALPKLVERCGAAKSGGSITAILAVLAETVDADDPITETMKSLLDGHIILSRQLAERGHFPAIDISKSLSRQSEALMSPDHQTLARSTRTHLAVYEEAQILIESGVYKPGTNKALDEAIARRGPISDFLMQAQTHEVALEQTLEDLRAALEESS